MKEYSKGIYVKFKPEEVEILHNLMKELEVHNLIYRSHQGLGKPNKICVYDLLKADNDNWLQSNLSTERGRTNEKEIL